MLPCGVTQCPDPDALPQTHAFVDAPALAQRAAELLRTPNALGNLSDVDAACVVEHMRLVNFGKGVTLFREGDGTRRAGRIHRGLERAHRVAQDTAAKPVGGAAAVPGLTRP